MGIVCVLFVLFTPQAGRESSGLAESVGGWEGGGRADLCNVLLGKPGDQE